MMQLTEFKAKLESQGTVLWPAAPELEFFWTFELSASREEIWPYISDTSRFNRELGLAPREQVEKDGKVIVTTAMLGFVQQWIEEPWMWAAGETIASTRTYLKGLAKKVHAVFHISDEGDKRLVYIYFGWQPANAFWKFLLKATANILKQNFERVFKKIDLFLLESRNRGANALMAAPQEIAEITVRKVYAIRERLLQRPNVSERAVQNLVDLVLAGDPLDIEPIRAIAWAQKWDMELPQVISTFLHATRLGLLRISWDVICPHCRGSRFSASSLGEIPEAASCGICNIDFSTSSDNSVEVTFHVQPSIRKVESLLFCAAEPAKKVHIKVQQLLKPGQTLNVQCDLKPGTYRARSLGKGWETRIQVDPMILEKSVELDRLTVQAKVGVPSQLIFRNDTADDMLFVLEELWWENSALKPSQVLSVPEFRDLFAEEHLSSNVKLSLGEQTILFSDIVGSTAFYALVGDAKAFAEVRAHFQDVFKIVQQHNGVVVKTMGDAVMASFSIPLDAVSAAFELQKHFHEGRSDTSIRLRIAIHSGPVIAVHLNSGLDYFGNTVNIGAKLQGVAGAGEVALSGDVYRELEVPFPVFKRVNKRDGAHNDAYVIRVPKVDSKAS